MDVLPRHAARRASGILTVTVLVGPPGSARRLWMQATERGGTPVLECSTEPLRDLREWASAHRAELRNAILHRLCERTGRDPQIVVREWAAMTRADADAFWNAVAPEPGDEALRTLLDPVVPLPADHTLAEFLQHPAFTALRPSLFAMASAPEGLTAWATFAERHPSIAVAVSVGEGVWEEFASKPSNTRAESIIREGELHVPTLETEEVIRRLMDGGIPETMAEALAETANDTTFVDEMIASFKNNASKPITKDADDKARSEAERYIFARLEDLQETKGRFRQNPDMPFKFRSRAAEIDLICDDPKIAIEVDGYYHFRDEDGYRRDREKDWELQRHGYVVLRFLAEDVTRHWDMVRDRIFAALTRDKQ